MMAWRVAGLCFVLLLALGCSKKPPFEVEIAGRAENRSGKALAGFALRFHPDDEINKHGRTLICLVQADGKFAGKGLPGKYKVTLVKPAVGSGADPGAGVTAAPVKENKDIPPAYADPGQTP